MSVDVENKQIYDSESDEYFDDENENDENMEVTNCLFCDNEFNSVDIALTHLENVHGIKLSYFKSKFRMDQLSFIKLVNCIRKDNITANHLLEAKEVFWNDEKYLKPISYESWLTFDFEGMPDDRSNGKLDDSENSNTATIQNLKEMCEYQASLLEQAAQDMQKMRTAYLRLVNDEKISKPKNSNCISDIPAKMDSSYFNSYSHFGIHYDMLSDNIRTTSYRDAFYMNKEFFNGKDVLDVGCGTGVLSMFASKAGAKQVVGVDNSDIIYNAMEIVKKNEIFNISLIKGRLEETDLPLEKYDVIISEWMGYFLLFEGMLDSIIYARDNHLKENGIILPNYCTMSLVGYGDEELYKKHVSFWDNVYDFDMSTMKSETLKEPLVEIVRSEHILTDANVIAEINLLTVDLNYSNFSYDFNLKCLKSGNLTSFVGYFDVSFDLPHKISFGTGPFDEPTHWKQVVFFLDEPHAVSKDDIVSGKIKCERSRNSLRSLNVMIFVYGKKFVYYLD